MNKIKAGRLKKRPEFLCVQHEGRKWVSPSIIVQALSYKDQTETRFGFTATKKIGNAVTRNRAKRRLRAVADEICQSVALVPSDIVLIARSETVTCEWNQLLKDLKWCLKRLDILADSQKTP